MELLLQRFLPFRLTRSRDVVLPAIVVLSVIMMVIPFPPWALDIFIALSLSAALVTIVMTMYITDALEFSVFPTWVLIITIFRIALNVSTTRSILSRGEAGHIIETFGTWVTGGNIVVGIVIFIILVAVNYIVIASGAQRIGEVAARFTLDAMPGKQMSIDADLTNGLITEDQARLRRSNLEREADYFGAMDGAARYVKGDAIVGIIIAIVNIGAGFIIGIFYGHLSASESFSLYTMLTVGEGLQGQIPALLMSVATGIVVTNAATDVNISQGLLTQLGAQPRALLVAGGAIFFLSLFPGMPKLVMWPIAAGLAAIAYVTLSTQQKQKTETERIEREESAAAVAPVEDTFSMITLDALELDLGYSLVPLVGSGREGDLLQKITSLRKSIAQELGFVIPPIRIRDNIGLKPQEYEIKLRGNPIARYEVQADRLLAIDPGGADEELPGTETHDPTFHMRAYWIAPEIRPQAELSGYTIVDPSGVITTHLSNIIRNNADELLDRESTKALVDKVKETHPTVVEELIPGGLSLGDVQKVLRNLLSEGISIRSLPEILEILADRIVLTKDPDLLTEYVRSGLARQISAKLVDLGKGTARVITVASEVEKMITDSLRQTAAGEFPILASESIDIIRTKLNKLLQKVETLGLKAVILVSPRNRLPMRRILAREYPDLLVVSFSEIVGDLPVEAIGILDLKEDKDEDQKV
jgi:flagellar biosynthesis protein FlhA